jgi:hypothetical protein
MDHRALGFALFRTALDQSRIAARAPDALAKQRGHARLFCWIMTFDGDHLLRPSPSHTKLKTFGHYELNLQIAVNFKLLICP